MKTEYIRTVKSGDKAQLLGITSAGDFYSFRLQTFHLGEQHITARSSEQNKEHSHKVFHAVLYTEDNEDNYFMLNGTRTKSCPGTLVLISPGVPHNFTPLQRGRTIYHELTFSLETNHRAFAENWSELLTIYNGQQLSLPEIPQKLPDYNMQRLEKHFEIIARNLKDGVNFNTLLAIAEMFGFLSSQIFAPAAKAAPTEQIEQVREFIEKHYADNLTLPEICRIAGQSPEHTCRKFKHKFGQSPMQYRQQLRLTAARRMLSFSSLKIAEIAERLGFADVYSFNKAFSKFCGTPPGKFRTEKQT